MSDHNHNAAEQWAAFLAHPWVKKWSLDISLSTYLCRKAIHELAVGCWSYQQMSRFRERLFTHPEANAAERHALQTFITSPFQAWYDRWRPHVDRWALHLAGLEDQYGYIGTQEDLASSIDGPGVLAEIADSIDRINEMMGEVRGLPKSAYPLAQEFIDAMLLSAERIEVICTILRKCDYLALLAYPGTKADISEVDRSEA